VLLGIYSRLTCCASVLSFGLQVNWALGALLSKVLQQGGVCRRETALALKSTAEHVCCASVLCLRLQVNWALGALLSEVLQQGGHALGRSHDHIILAAPGAEQGTSDAVAAAIAASFCMFMLLLSACLNHCRVGVGGAAVAALPAAAGLGLAGNSNARSGGGAGSSGSRAAAGSSSSSSGGISGVVSGLVAAAVSAAADASSGAGQGGSRGKYTRLRAVSPNTYAGAGEQLQLPVSTTTGGSSNSSSSRPASRPPSVGHSGGGVIEVAAYAAGQPLSDRVSSQGGRVSAGVLTSRR
jgi:hypothetical protein